MLKVMQDLMKKQKEKIPESSRNQLRKRDHFCRSRVVIPDTVAGVGAS
jgi:hypothetical protein